VGKESSERIPQAARVCYCLTTRHTRSKDEESTQITASGRNPGACKVIYALGPSAIATPGPARGQILLWQKCVSAMAASPLVIH